jgi:Tetracyclin repressor-like, C-terminal domain
LAVIAEQNKALFENHPWAATISTIRPPLGPGMMAKYEHELSALEGLGLDDVQMDASLTYLLSFVQAWARAAADARAVHRDTAMDDSEWWTTSGHLLARVLDETAYPIAARVGSAAGTAHGSAYSPDQAYTFGLERVLAGLSALIDPN